MNSSRYRSDIDGLRAVAVISVLLFHVDFTTFSGGYVGVDVFFVISGFLITRLIRDEVVKTNDFSFANFYLRRARRLFPALFFTLCASFLTATVMFTPDDLQRFGGSLIHAIMSVSNFYFWSESGYFTTEAEYRPLLHTWSLSVEEQFYMIWPIVLVFLLIKTPRYSAPAILILVGAISFGLNLVFANGFTYFKFLGNIFADGAPTIFFLTPFRIFELGIGALVVWIIDYQPRNKMLLEPLALIGLAMIAYAVFTYTETTLFPSYNALFPCIGTALIIYAGTARYSGKLLSNKLAVGIGLISYSLYLIHWPMIVFYKYWKSAELTMIEQVAICAASIVGAILMYRFVEQPFRRASSPTAWSRPAFGLSCSMLALLLILPSANTWATGGWTWRLPITEQLRLGDRRFLADYVSSYFVSRQDHRFNMQDARENVLIIGDSMGQDFANILNVPYFQRRLELATIKISTRCQIIFGATEETYQKFYQDSALRERCREVHQRTLDDPRVKAADRVVLVANWRMRSVKYIENTLETLRRKGAKNIYIVGPKKQANAGVNKLFGLSAINSGWSAQTKLRTETRAINGAMRRILPSSNFLEINKYVCNSLSCETLDGEGHPIFWDSAHLTPYGVAWLREKLIEDNWYFNHPFFVGSSEKAQIE